MSLRSSSQQPPKLALFESASGSVDLGFDSESGQTNDLKIGIHSFPA